MSEPHPDDVPGVDPGVVPDASDGDGLADSARLVADVLDQRASADGVAERRDLADQFRGVLGPAPDRDAEVVVALEALRSAAPGEWSAARADPGAAEVTRMAQAMDRLEARRRRRREAEDAARARSTREPVPSGAAADWTREIRDLVRDRLADKRDLLADYLDSGIATAGALAECLLADGEEEARDLVERAGRSWRNYRSLYRAARLATGRDRPWRAPERVSGVVSAISALSGVGSSVDVDGSPRPNRPVRGRAVIVRTLVDRTSADGPSTSVVVAPGGMGKTTVVADVARQVRGRGLGVFWIDAPDLNALAAGLEQVALRMEFTQSELQRAHRAALSPKDHVMALWALLDQRERWLIVLDDVPESAVGGAAWTRGPRRGSVLLTTRHGDAESWAPAIVHELHELEGRHAARLLLDRFDLALGPDRVPGTDTMAREEAAVDRLCTLLPGIPLALVSVGDMLARTGERDLEGRVEALTSQSWEDAVSAVYDTCLAALGTGRRRGRHLLRLLACFAADEPLLERVVAEVAERAPAEAGGADGVDELVRVGLVERLDTRDHVPCLRLHPAIAEYSRLDYGDGDRVVEIDARAVQLLEDERARLDAGYPADWPAVLALEPHVLEVVESPAFVPGRMDDELAARVLTLADRTSTALMRSGHHESATTLLDRAMMRFSWLGPLTPPVLAARLTRAWMVALDRGGNLPDARARLETLLEVCERELGHRSAITVSVGDTLGWVLAEQDELDAARRLIEEVVRIRDGREALGVRSALASRHRLAWIQAMSGEVETAVAVFRRVLAERMAVLGSSHLDVLSTRYRLAWALSRLGEHDLARRQFDVLLRQAEEILGVDHPLALMVRSRVAWAAMWAGDLREARSEYSTLVPEQQKVLGADHPRVLVNEHNLAAISLRLGDPFRAEEELRSVVWRREKLLGSDHPYSMDSREMHAWALFRAGRAEDADRELSALLADRTRVFGEEHPATLDARYRIARVVLHRGRVGDAEERLRVLGEDLACVFPRRDPRILRARHALALALGLQGSHPQASVVLRSTLVGQTIVLGRDDQETLATRDRIVWLDGVAGRLDDLVQSAQQVLADRARVLGSDHPHTDTSRYRLAWALLRTGRLSEASEAYEQLVDDLSRTRGERHPHTLRARIGRLQLRRLRGRVGDVLEEADDLVAVLTAAQGRFAVATLRAEEERAHVQAVLGELDQAARRFRDVRLRQSRVMGGNHLDVHRLYRLEGGVLGEPPAPTPDSASWR